MHMWCNAWSLKIIFTKTHPKILTKTQKFEKSQKISKTPKVRSKIMKMHDKDEESIIPDEEQRSWDRKRSEEDEKLEFWVIKRRREVCLSRGIEENWDRNCENPIYRKIINLDRLRAIEKLSRFKTCLLAIEELTRSYRGSTKRFSQQKSSMDWGSYRTAIEETESFSIDRTSYQELSRMR